MGESQWGGAVVECPLGGAVEECPLGGAVGESQWGGAVGESQWGGTMGEILLTLLRQSQTLLHSRLLHLLHSSHLDHTITFLVLKVLRNFSF